MDTVMSLSDSLFQRVDQVRSRLEVDVCSLYLAHPGKPVLEIVATSGLSERAVSAKLSFDQGLTGKVARTRKPVAARDIQNHADYFHVEDSNEERFKSYLGIPLERDSELVGVLVIQTEQTRTFFLRHVKELHSAARDLMAGLSDAISA